MDWSGAERGAPDAPAAGREDCAFKNGEMVL